MYAPGDRSVVRHVMAKLYGEASRIRRNNIEGAAMKAAEAA
jgi:hypothetical protein